MESHHDRALALVLVWLFYFARGGIYMAYDVAIIGAGVVGALIARELSRFDLKLCLVDREADVAMGTTKANSAIVHAGYDAAEGSLKARLNVLGNSMMEQLARELHVPFRRTGSLVLAFDEKDMTVLEQLLQRGIANGVPGLAILDGEAVKRLEPQVSGSVLGALHAPTAGIVCPYELAIGAAENAVINGAEIRLGFEVAEIRHEKDGFTLVSPGGEVSTRYVVNAAGLYADKVAAMAGDSSFSIKPRKGEYLLMDKSQGGLVKSVIFQTPSSLGKGILVTPTVDGNLLLGPTAVDLEDREDTSTTGTGLEKVINGALRLVPGISSREAVTSFAGLRAVPSDGDFIIAPAKGVRGFVNAAGIESPGLSASPAIAGYVAGLLEKEGLRLKPREGFNPVRQPIRHLKDLPDCEKEELIKSDPMYGRIICRCEGITEGEIVESIRRPVGATNLDAVKRRTRSGMGRCQGGFCTPRLIEILSRELGIPMEEVTKNGGNSRLLAGKK